jgi:hypothetical protein
MMFLQQNVQYIELCNTKSSSGQNSEISSGIANAWRCNLLDQFLIMISEYCTVLVSYRQQWVSSHIISKFIMKKHFIQTL